MHIVFNLSIVGILRYIIDESSRVQFRKFQHKGNVRCIKFTIYSELLRQVESDVQIVRKIFGALDVALQKRTQNCLHRSFRKKLLIFNVSKLVGPDKK